MRMFQMFSVVALFGSFLSAEDKKEFIIPKDKVWTKEVHAFLEVEEDGKKVMRTPQELHADPYSTGVYGEYSGTRLSHGGNKIRFLRQSIGGKKIKPTAELPEMEEGKPRLGPDEETPFIVTLDTFEGFGIDGQKEQFLVFFIPWDEKKKEWGDKMIGIGAEANNVYGSLDYIARFPRDINGVKMGLFVIESMP